MLCWWVLKCRLIKYVYYVYGYCVAVDVIPLLRWWGYEIDLRYGRKLLLYIRRFLPERRRCLAALTMISILMSWPTPDATSIVRVEAFAMQCSIVSIQAWDSYQSCNRALSRPLHWSARPGSIREWALGSYWVMWTSAVGKDLLLVSS